MRFNVRNEGIFVDAFFTNLFILMIHSCCFFPQISKAEERYLRILICYCKGLEEKSHTIVLYASFLKCDVETIIR